MVKREKQDINHLSDHRSIKEVTSRDRNKKIKPLRVCNGEERSKKKENKPQLEWW